MDGFPRRFGSNRHEHNVPSRRDEEDGAFTQALNDSAHKRKSDSVFVPAEGSLCVDRGRVAQLHVLLCLPWESNANRQRISPLPDTLRSSRGCSDTARNQTPPA